MKLLYGVAHPLGEKAEGVDHPLEEKVGRGARPREKKEKWLTRISRFHSLTSPVTSAAYVSLTRSARKSLMESR